MGSRLSLGFWLDLQDSSINLCVCVCMCAAVCLSRSVSLREQEDRQTKPGLVLFLYIYFCIQETLCINGPFLCMCVHKSFMSMAVHVFVTQCVMRCLYDKHKASLRGILIRGFATVVMETALSSCISQWR